MFESNTQTSYVTDFDMRKEALSQAVQVALDPSSPQLMRITGEILRTADDLYKFLKGR